MGPVVRGQLLPRKAPGREDWLLRPALLHVAEEEAAWLSGLGEGIRSQAELSSAGGCSLGCLSGWVLPTQGP